MGRATKTAKEIFGYLEKNPIIDIKKTSKELSLAFSTVSASVKRLEECGILVQTNNASRNRVFAFSSLLFFNAALFFIWYFKIFQIFFKLILCG